MFKKKKVQKFLFRWLVVNVVFFLVKATMESEYQEMHSFFSATNMYYYCTTFFLFMVTWNTMTG